MKRTLKNDLKKLRVCLKHPRSVVHDTVLCPACAAEREFLKLTKGMFPSKRYRF